MCNRHSDGMALRGSTEPDVGCSEAALAVLMEALEGAGALCFCTFCLEAMWKRSLETSFQRPLQQGAQGVRLGMKEGFMGFDSMSETSLEH